MVYVTVGIQIAYTRLNFGNLPAFGSNILFYGFRRQK